MRRKETNFTALYCRTRGRQKRWRLFNIDIENYAFCFTSKTFTRSIFFSSFFNIIPRRYATERKKSFIKFKFIVCSEIIFHNISLRVVSFRKVLLAASYWAVLMSSQQMEKVFSFGICPDDLSELVQQGWNFYALSLREGEEELKLRFCPRKRNDVNMSGKHFSAKVFMIATKSLSNVIA